MKKLLALFMVIATTVVVAYGQVVQVRQDSQSFINKGTYVMLSNNFTLSYGSLAGGIYYGSPGSNILYVPYSLGTNVVGGSFGPTNASGYSNQYPAILTDITPVPNPDGSVPLAAIAITWNIETNYALVVANPGTNGVGIPLIPTIGNQRTWIPYPGFTNSDGSQGVPHSLFAASVDRTNEITLTFSRSIDGYNFPILGTAGANETFVWIVSNSAANIVAGRGVTMVTNLPTAFVQGAAKIRLIKVATDNKAAGTAGGVTINDIRYSQPYH